VTILVKTRVMAPAERCQTRMRSCVVRQAMRFASPALAHTLYPCVDSPALQSVTLAPGADRVPERVPGLCVCFIPGLCRRSEFITVVPYYKAVRLRGLMKSKSPAWRCVFILNGRKSVPKRRLKIRPETFLNLRKFFHSPLPYLHPAVLCY
jgi:hypothetical protein